MSYRSFWRFVPALALAACSTPTVDDICERLAECPDADPGEVAECKEEGNAFADEAIAAGCEDQLDDYLSCIDGIEVCNEEALENSCRAEADAMGACQSQDDPPAPG